MLSVETIHSRFIAKFKSSIETTYEIKESAEDLLEILRRGVRGKSRQLLVDKISSMKLNLLVDSFECLQSDYKLACVGILSSFYVSSGGEVYRQQYMRAVETDNFAQKCDELIERCLDSLRVLRAAGSLVLSKEERKNFLRRIAELESSCAEVLRMTVETTLETIDYTTCRCGSRFTWLPDTSEQLCTECFRVRKVDGAGCNESESKGKSSSYEFRRHFNFWMEHLMAREKKTFPQAHLDKIGSIIAKNMILKSELNCEVMRRVLKVANLTMYNDHTPLLVVIFGGAPPPQFSFQELKEMGVMFDKIMNLYTVINPDTKNYPYYPYFIYQVVSSKFRGVPEKLRFLDYIHLQSRETMNKNDHYYKKICELSDPEDGLVYAPIDPSRR